MGILGTVEVKLVRMHPDGWGFIRAQKISKAHITACISLVNAVLEQFVHDLKVMNGHAI